ncbi:hypothetical protein C0995_005636, partial [Termitomyces sp. Mi166
RFLLCKHLVQAVHPVPAVFFLDVKRRRTTPFWKHQSLKPIFEKDGGSAPSKDSEDQADDEEHVGQDDGDGGDSEGDDDESEGEIIDTRPEEDDNRLTFEETMEENIKTILDFAKGLEYQIQFRDHRMLQALERDGSSFLRLARACLVKEKRMRSTRGKTLPTWDKSTL